MDSDHVDRSVGIGLRLARAAVGLGVNLAMMSVRLVLRAVIPPGEAHSPQGDPHTPPDRSDARVDVEEPWAGYDGMTVDEVRRRLRGVSPEVVAAVRTYEQAHKNRKGVLGATGLS